MVAIDSSENIESKERLIDKRNSLFNELITRLTLDIQGYRHLSNTEAVHCRSRIKNDLDKAEALTRELVSLPGAERRQAEIDRIRSLKVLYMNDLPRPIEVGVNTKPMDKGQFNRSPFDSPNDNTQGSSDMMMMRDVDDRLIETQRLAAEAEHIGNTTMNDLKRQREQLERARRNLYQTDSALDDSNRLMTAITRRY